VVLDVGDGLVFEFAGVAGGRLGDVEGGDLEAVEEQSGAAGVEGVARDAGEDLADGDLDGGAVFDHRQVEGGGQG
jgi:hypothetical protein